MNFSVQVYTYKFLEFRFLISPIPLFGFLWSYFERGEPRKVSVFNAKGPPVPIPNTEVKLCSAENTCLETDREDRSTLTLFQAKLEKART